MYTIILILQIRRLKHREVILCAQSHTTSKWQSPSLWTRGCLTPACTYHYPHMCSLVSTFIDHLECGIKFLKSSYNFLMLYNTNTSGTFQHKVSWVDRSVHLRETPVVPQ